MHPPRRNQHRIWHLKYQQRGQILHRLETQRKNQTSWGGLPVPGDYQTYSLEGDDDFLEESCGGSSDGGSGGGGSNGGGLMKPMVRLEIGVTRMQVSVPRIHIGDNLT